MDRQAVRETFQGILRDVFDDASIVVGDDTRAADIDGWDSLMHINIIIAVEQEFGVKFATAEISNLKNDDQNVGSFLDLVSDKVSKQS